MQVLETKVFRGPNFYSLHHHVIRLTIDLEELEEYPSDRLGDFNHNLTHLMPSLWSHRCSEGKPGGFFTRLQEGTWMGHIIEHVALELQCLAGTECTFGKSRSIDNQPGAYTVIYEYQEEKVGLAAGKLALRLVRSLLPAHLPSALGAEERAAFDFHQELAALIRLASRVALGPSTHALVRAAERRGIPWMRLDDQSLVQLGYGKHQKRIQATITGHTGQIATEIASDKRLTNQLLYDAGLPVPRHLLVESEDEAVEAAEDIGYPVVTKPLDLNHGRGATLNLRTPDQVREGYRVAAEAGGSSVLVEKYLTGNDYRILVVNGQVVAVAQRVPGHVVGDGEHTIAELVEKVNADPRRGTGHEKVLTRIELDEQAHHLLREAGLTPESILDPGEVCYLRATANLSTGGTAIDRTDEIHEANIEIARRVAETIGLDVAGIDLITADIAEDVYAMGGGIVEVNAAPGFRMHVAPTEGLPRDVAGPVIDMLFPPGAQARIPIVAVTGTNGKTTTCAMVAHIMKNAGYTVGLTTTNGIYVDGQRIHKGDMSGPWSARVVLRHPQVDAAVLETARGGILREGLGFDRCDVGAILNVSSDHLGLKGVNTLEQLAQVKSLVAEVVAKNGHTVLNADDPLVAKMAGVTNGEVVYFCMSGRNRIVREHVERGGTAVVLEKSINGSLITVYRQGRFIPVVHAPLIPATLYGKARFNIANALAATAIAYSMGISVPDIRQSLMTFDTSFNQVPGRLNIFDECGFRVIVDYAHNPAAMTAMCDLVRKMRRTHKTAVLAPTGDRRDADICTLGHIVAGAFDSLVVKEDHNLRGRAPGEAAELLARCAREAGMPASQIQIIRDETEAVGQALRTAQPGSLVVVFADDVDGVWQQVTAFHAQTQTGGCTGGEDRAPLPTAVRSGFTTRYRRKDRHEVVPN